MGTGFVIPPAFQTQECMYTELSVLKQSDCERFKDELQWKHETCSECF